MYVIYVGSGISAYRHVKSRRTGLTVAYPTCAIVGRAMKSGSLDLSHPTPAQG